MAEAASLRWPARIVSHLHSIGGGIIARALLTILFSKYFYQNEIEVLVALKIGGISARVCFRQHDQMSRSTKRFFLNASCTVAEKYFLDCMQFMLLEDAGPQQ